jgi:hypothetical protein
VLNLVELRDHRAGDLTHGDAVHDDDGFERKVAAVSAILSRLAGPETPGRRRTAEGQSLLVAGCRRRS